MEHQSSCGDNIYIGLRFYRLSDMTDRGPSCAAGPQKHYCHRRHLGHTFGSRTPFYQATERSEFTFQSSDLMQLSPRGVDATAVRAEVIGVTMASPYPWRSLRMWRPLALF